MFNWTGNLSRFIPHARHTPSLISQHMAERVRQSLQDTPAVLVNGPRQCGKTTLAEQFAHGMQYITLDDATTGGDCARVSAVPHQTAAALQYNCLPVLDVVIARVLQLIGTLGCWHRQNCHGGGAIVSKFLSAQLSA